MEDVKREITHLQKKRSQSTRYVWDLNRRTPMTCVKVWFLGFIFAVTLFMIQRGGF